MKTTLYGLLATVVLATAAPAMAQDSESFTVQTTVPAFCSQLSSGTTPAMNLGSLTGATGQLVAAFNGTETQRELAANFYCNAPSTVTIEAVPLKHETVSFVADGTSFTNRVDYTATIKWRDLEGTVSSTASAPQEIPASQANIGSLLLSLSAPVVDGNRRPVAGDYAGQVRLTIALSQ